MTGILTKKEIWTQTCTQGECGDEDEGRDHGDAPASQGTPKTASRWPEAWQEAGDRLALRVLRRNRPCHHVTLGLQASRTVKQQISPV